MLIINADDWGATRYVTDKIMDCIQQETVTSVSAMVFMDDSGRAAELALSRQVDTGLHLNLSQPFSDSNVPQSLRESQARIVTWLRCSKLAQAVYNPFLRRDFAHVFMGQYQEYKKLYKKDPLRIDGHNHMHLCANMLVDQHIPQGTCVRKNISFVKEEQKGFINKFFRKQVDCILAKRYRCTDYFFHIRQISPASNEIRYPIFNKIVNLASHSVLELLVHPGQNIDYDFVTCTEFREHIAHVPQCSFSSLHSKNKNCP